MGHQSIECPECHHKFAVHTDIIDEEIDRILENDWMFHYHRCGRESERNIKLARENEELRGDMAALSKTKENLREEHEFIDRIIKKYENNPHTNP